MWLESGDTMILGLEVQAAIATSSNVQGTSGSTKIPPPTRMQTLSHLRIERAPECRSAAPSCDATVIAPTQDLRNRPAAEHGRTRVLRSEERRARKELR